MQLLSDYKEILTAAITQRRQRNSGYSMRAFARDIGMKPSQLSDIFNGRKGLSIDNAYRIAGLLGLNEHETAKFCDLVELKHGRSPVARKMAAQRVKTHLESVSFTELSHDVMRMIADWYHMAILFMTDLDDFDADAAKISKRLGISVLEAKDALDRLKRLKMLEDKKGKLARARGYEKVTSSVDVPSQSIRQYHEQMLHKAIDALHSQNVTDRDISSITIAIDRSRIPEAKQRIEAFRREMAAFLEAGKKRDGLYTFALQLFSLEQHPQSKIFQSPEGR